jgi:lysozyme
MDLIAQLRRDEGVRNFPYVDTVGKTTIGVGRNLTDVGLSDAEVDLLLANDIAKVQGQLAPFGWYVKLDPVRQAAIQNMAFNLGIGGLLHFPAMIHYLQMQDWKGAHDEALNSAWASQVGARAQRIATQLMTGQWT